VPSPFRNVANTKPRTSEFALESGFSQDQIESVPSSKNFPQDSSLASSSSWDNSWAARDKTPQGSWAARDKTQTTGDSRDQDYWATGDVTSETLGDDNSGTSWDSWAKTSENSSNQTSETSGDKRNSGNYGEDQRPGSSWDAVRMRSKGTISNFVVNLKCKLMND
jgi:hypothetical protein